MTLWIQLGMALVGVLPDICKKSLMLVNPPRKEQGQEIQLAQLKLQYLQHQENQKFQAEQSWLNHEKQKELQEYIQSVNLAIHQGNIEFQKWRFEQEKALQQELVNYQRQTQLEIAAYQRETALKLAHVQAEVQKIFANWPLTLPPAQILESHSSDSQIPLRVFIAPPKVQFERFANVAQSFPDVELTLNQKLREFFNNYSRQGRSIEFLAGAWESKQFHSEASIKALFGMLKSEPTLILESEIDGDYLNFRLAYWGLGQKSYYYQTIISRLSYRDILYDAAKTRALKWKATKEKLLALGKTPAEVEKRGGDNEINLKFLEEEEVLKEAGIDNEELQIHYQINGQHFEDLYNFLITCHCLVAGWIADSHHLFLYDIAPLLPELLPDLTQNLPDREVVEEVIGAVVSGYQEIYKAIEVERSHWVPDLMLQLTQGLVNLPDKSWAKSQVIESILAWLKLRNFKRNKVFEQNSVLKFEPLLDAVDSVLTANDLPYIQKLNDCLTAVGETHRINVIDACYKRGMRRCQQGEYSEAISDFTQVLQINPNFPEVNYNRGLAYAKLGQFPAAIENYTQELRLNPNHAEAYNNRGNAYYKLGEYQKAIADYNQAISLNPNLPGVVHNRDVAQGVLEEKVHQQREEEKQKRREEEERIRREEEEQKRREEEERIRREEEERKRREREFEFDVITVNAQGQQTNRRRCRAEFFKQDLGNGVILEMVSIPGGTFMMGSSENEGDADEKPQHQVNIAPFYIGKYAVTQAQWKVVAALPKINIDLNPDPSDFKGANRPIEQVTWHEAQEFCQRLSQKTGKTYRLPSEAEWEYACRAGTMTPFHFGLTITVDLANYDGNYTYASAPKGTYRKKTTDVGSFSPNAFGLYDMHGNVWEWCADPWHENYNGAPSNGSVWQPGGNNQYRMLRGGSWFNSPKYCRSASRLSFDPDSRFCYCGFRVVAVASAWTY